MKFPLAEHLLETLASISSEEAVRVLNVSPELAELLGDEITTRFSMEFGGLQFYIPKGRVFHKYRLHRQIWDAFTGTNHAELAVKFRVSLQHIYATVARERERERRERQQTLPGVST